MNDDSLDDVKFAGRIKTQTFKQYQQELLIKALVMPASKLVEVAKRDAERQKELELAAEDEKRHRRTAARAPQDKLNNLPLIRERFEE